MFGKTVLLKTIRLGVLLASILLCVSCFASDLPETTGIEQVPQLPSNLLSDEPVQGTERALPAKIENPADIDYPPPVKNCGKDYTCLEKATMAGERARVVNTEPVESLSMIETSEVMIRPFRDHFEVVMTVVDLKPIQDNPEPTKSVLGTAASACPRIRFNTSRIISTRAVCYTKTPQQAMSLAVQGLSNEAIQRYSCTGDLISNIKAICRNDHFPQFPYGVKKPAVYLYPVERTDIDVRLSVNGIIDQSDPAYQSGWHVKADPSGLIDNRYEYLFYEARLKQLALPQEGWVVEYRSLNAWFDTILIKLGLNEKEKNHFKEYWLRELPVSGYYEIKLLETAFLKEHMALLINPQPDTLIRLNFHFRPLQKSMPIKAPVIIEPVRKGFTVVEWGGLLYQDPKD